MQGRPLSDIVCCDPLTNTSKSAEGFFAAPFTTAPFGSGSRKGFLDVELDPMPGNGNCWLVVCSFRGEGEVPPMRLRKGLLEPNVKLEGEGWRSAGEGRCQ